MVGEYYISPRQSAGYGCLVDDSGDNSGDEAGDHIDLVADLESCVVVVGSSVGGQLNDYKAVLGHLATRALRFAVGVDGQHLHY